MFPVSKSGSCESGFGGEGGKEGGMEENEKFPDAFTSTSEA